MPAENSVDVKPVMQDLCHWRKIVLVTGTLLCALFTNGVVFGWESAAAMLQLEQQYTYLCPNVTTSSNWTTSGYIQTTATPVTKPHGRVVPSTCAEQEKRLSLIFVVTITCIGLAQILTGIILDRFGAGPTFLIGTVLFLSGMMLLTFSDTSPSAHSEHRMFDCFIPGYPLIGLGGVMISYSSMLAATLFENPKITRTLISALNVFFDMSAFVFGPFLSIVLANIATRKVLFLLYAGFAGLLFVITGLGWYLNREKAFGHKKKSEKTDSDDKDDGIEMKDSMQSSFLEPPPDPEDKDYDDPGGEVEDVADMAFLRQLRTFEYFTLAAFTIVHVLKLTMFLGTARLLFQTLGDEDHDLLLSRSFAYLMLAGVLTVFVVEFIIRKVGIINSLQVVNILGITLSISALVPSLYLQYFTTVIVTWDRGLFYSFIFTMAFEVFGAESVGRIMGLTQTVAALVNLTQYPIVSFLETKMDGNPFVLNVALLVLNLPLFVLIFCLDRKRKGRASVK